MKCCHQVIQGSLLCPPPQLPFVYSPQVGSLPGLHLWALLLTPYSHFLGRAPSPVAPVQFGMCEHPRYHTPHLWRFPERGPSRAGDLTPESHGPHPSSEPDFSIPSYPCCESVPGIHSRSCRPSPHNGHRREVGQSGRQAGDVQRLPLPILNPG